MKLRTCVTPDGKFIYGIHKPSFRVANMRQEAFLQSLGIDDEENPIENTANFPAGEVEEPQGEWIYEVPNPFPFRGATYISKSWADSKATANPTYSTASFESSFHRPFAIHGGGFSPSMPGLPS